MVKSKILVPLLNTNEPETRVASIHITTGEWVKKGTPIFTLETTKVTADVESPADGFVYILTHDGDMRQVGDILAIISDSEMENLGDELSILSPEIQNKPDASVKSQIRITNPAKILAESLDIDLAVFPSDQLITEEMVRSYSGKKPREISLPESQKPFVVIYGGGGHAKTLVDMILTLDKLTIAGIVDDKLPAGKKVMGFPVLGTRGILPAVFAQGVKLAVNAVGGIEDINSRVKIFDLLEKNGFTFPTLIHPRATIEPSAKIGLGVQVFANSYVGSEAVLEPMCMVNTSAVVSHDCLIGAYTHIAPGALLAGHVQVGEKTLVGMGAATNIGVKIGREVRVGNLANILADVPDQMIVQAGRFWVGIANAR